MKSLLLYFFLIVFIGSSYGQSVPTMRYEDKIRIREAALITESFGDEIWKGINKVPFVVLLVNDSVEFLINHPYPSSDFQLSENDSILKSKIYYRPRVYPEWYLATFPAVNGVSCIVVGTPEKTKKNSTEWVITLLHEHFHQYQFSSPNYFGEVDKLDLSGGDQSGMWQLNFNFPYTDPALASKFREFSNALYNAVLHNTRQKSRKYFKEYVSKRMALKQMLEPSHYRYLSFQIWQEGIARYTEYAFVKSLRNYQPTFEMLQMEDYEDFKSYEDKIYLSELGFILNQKIEQDKRICFYAIGFAEGILLSKYSPKWRDRYLVNKFYVEDYFEKPNSFKR